MSTRAEFLTNLRIRLDDTDANGYRWSDDELNLYLAESAMRYSKVLPRRRDQEFTADGSTRYNAPADLLDRQIHEVMTVRGSTATDIPNKMFRFRNSSRWFEVIDAELVFGFIIPSGTTIQLRYGATHTMPDDDVTDSSVPDEDTDMIYLWAEALAWRRLSGNDAALSRWKEDGSRDDSPMIPHHVLLERQYEKLAREKKAGGRFLTLVRPQSRNRLSDLR